MCVCLCQQHMWLSWVCREGASRAWDGGGEECCSLAKKILPALFWRCQGLQSCHHDFVVHGISQTRGTKSEHRMHSDTDVSILQLKERSCRSS